MKEEENKFVQKQKTNKLEVAGGFAKSLIQFGGEILMKEAN